MSEPMNDMSLGVISETGKKISVYIIYISRLGGFTEIYDTVYKYKYVAEQVAEYLKGEWVSTKVDLIKAEVITGERCLIERKIYALDRTTRRQKIRQHALAKLNDEEKKVLGIK